MKIVYLITTFGCSACNIQKNILKEYLQERSDVVFLSFDFNNCPEYVKTNIKLTDFPVTIFENNDVIKYHFTGTKSISKIKKIIQNIDF